MLGWDLVSSERQFGYRHIAEALPCGDAAADRTRTEVVYERVAHCPLPHIWIYLLREAVLAQAKELEARWKSDKAGMPLYGIPYAIRTISMRRGTPTAACPGFVTCRLSQLLS